jgi:hypothetical protein
MYKLCLLIFLIIIQGLALAEGATLSINNIFSDDESNCIVLSNPPVMYKSLVKLTSHDRCFAEISRMGRPKQQFFTDIHAQYGNLVVLNLGIGKEINKYSYVALAYHIGRNEYITNFISPYCADCNFVFHGLKTGVGIPFFLPLNNNTNFFINAAANIGIELIFNNAYFDYSSTPFIFNPFFEPQVFTGLSKGKMWYYIGVKHYTWLIQTMTAERYPLTDINTGEGLGWGADLFPGRGGLNVVAGIRYFF